MEHAQGLVFALALGVGVLAHAIARHLRVPSILPLLAVGVACGPDGLGWIDPRSLGDGLFQIVGVAVAVILFEGGLNLELSRIRAEDATIRRLISVGALITAVGAALAARLLLGWAWDLAWLLGTLVIVTGPTVIRPILRNVTLRPRLATMLEAEGVLIDPVGAIVAAVTLQVVLGPGLDSFGSGLVSLALRLAFGAGAGALGGLVLGALLRWERVVPEGLENLAALGGSLVLFAACEAALSESGILAVTVAGVVVGNLESRTSRELQEFQEQLTIALIGVLFVLLAADVRIADVFALGWPGLLTVAALMLLVRPANVLLSTLGSGLSFRERAFLCWMAPRGIVAAALASLFAVEMERAGLAGGDEVRALVFLTIAVTVVVQGGTAPLAARLLRVAAPDRAGAVILGAEGLALALGDALRRDGADVVVVDVNPQHCRAAEERGFRVVLGNGLELRTVARARPEYARAAIGLTGNDNANSLFARELRQEFRVPETYVALLRQRGGVTQEILDKQASRVLFDGPKDVERWNVRFRHDAAAVARFRFAGVPEGAAPASNAARPAPPGWRAAGSADPYVILALRRGDAWRPMHVGLEPGPGDEVLAALHRPETELARERLRELGWAGVDGERS